MSIQLKIYLPNKVFAHTKADKVVLPVSEGTLTVIHDRAPRSQLLTEGIIALLDEHNQTFKQWKIPGGIAEIAEDVCILAVEDIKEI